MMPSKRFVVLIQLCIIVVQYQHWHNGSSSSSIFCFATRLVEKQRNHLRQAPSLSSPSSSSSSSSLMLFPSPSLIRGRPNEFSTFSSTIHRKSPSTTKNGQIRNVNDENHNHYHRTLSTTDQNKLHWIGIYTFLFCSMIILISILIIFGILPSLRSRQKYDNSDNNIPNHYNASYFCCCCWYGRSTLILLFRSSTRTMVTEGSHDTQSVTVDQPCTNHTTMITKNDALPVQIDNSIDDESKLKNHNLNILNDNHPTITTDTNQINPTVDTTKNIQNDTSTTTSSMNNHYVDTIDDETKQKDGDLYENNNNCNVPRDLSNHNSNINTNTKMTTTTTNDYCYDYDQDHTILVDVYHHYEYQEETDNLEIY
jgi:hypothetical protein